MGRLHGGKIPPMLLIDNNNVGQFPNKLHYWTPLE
jgi:hypothetical protein